MYFATVKSLFPARVWPKIDQQRIHVRNPLLPLGESVILSCHPLFVPIVGLHVAAVETVQLEDLDGLTVSRMRDTLQTESHGCWTLLSTGSVQEVFVRAFA